MATEPTVSEPKRVPKRNDIKPSGLYRGTKSLELQGRDPAYEYQYFSEDPKSPGRIGHRLGPHEHGEINGLKQMIDGWEVVHSQTDKDVRAMSIRQDQGKPIDSIRRYGDQILCRILKTEHAKYAETDIANQENREKQLFSPDRVRGAQASMTAVVMNGDQDETARTQALIDAGHPIPGVRRSE